ncbi:hypothetical protein UFOVP270_4 [uncultured Caudovirales phage]|uniref:Uncharacterized protein n=1 Tax=uncultured Caudovirales phage TaxID=2100421 RepID=A0A6J5LHE2_9CAUD|nr:hypothetical protein UFOVP101_52 [uncultured Caudovirales phage]CAB4134004.1 hypothetical protein UFOVP270_4 [uncultured Caudovirales phage]
MAYCSQVGNNAWLKRRRTNKMNEKEVDTRQKISEYQYKLLDFLFNNKESQERDNDCRQYEQGGF